MKNVENRTSNEEPVTNEDSSCKKTGEITNSLNLAIDKYTQDKQSREQDVKDNISWKLREAYKASAKTVDEDEINANTNEIYNKYRELFQKDNTPGPENKNVVSSVSNPPLQLYQIFHMSKDTARLPTELSNQTGSTQDINNFGINWDHISKAVATVNSEPNTLNKSYKDVGPIY